MPHRRGIGKQIAAAKTSTPPIAQSGSCRVGWPVPRPGFASPANVSKRGLSAPVCPHNQTLILVKERLLKSAQRPKMTAEFVSCAPLQPLVQDVKVQEEPRTATSLSARRGAGYQCRCWRERVLAGLCQHIRESGAIHRQISRNPSIGDLGAAEAQALGSRIVFSRAVTRHGIPAHHFKSALCADAAFAFICWLFVCVPE